MLHKYYILIWFTVSFNYACHIAWILNYATITSFKCLFKSSTCTPVAFYKVDSQLGFDFTSVTFFVPDLDNRCAPGVPKMLSPASFSSVLTCSWNLVTSRVHCLSLTTCAKQFNKYPSIVFLSWYFLIQNSRLFWQIYSWE